MKNSVNISGISGPDRNNQNNDKDISNIFVEESKEKNYKAHIDVYEEKISVLTSLWMHFNLKTFIYPKSFNKNYSKFQFFKKIISLFYGHVRFFFSNFILFIDFFLFFESFRCRILKRWYY